MSVNARAGKIQQQSLQRGRRARYPLFLPWCPLWLCWMGRRGWDSWAAKPSGWLAAGSYSPATHTLLLVQWCVIFLFGCGHGLCLVPGLCSSPAAGGPSRCPGLCPGSAGDTKHHCPMCDSAPGLCPGSAGDRKHHCPWPQFCLFIWKKNSSHICVE